MHPTFKTLLIFVGAGSLLAAPLVAQTAELERRTESLSWDSGTLDGNSDGPRLGAHDVLSVPGVPWIQLRFAEAELGAGSYLEITSVADGARQRLDRTALQQWRHQSAYFNGDAVEVRLFVGSQDRDVRASIEEVVVGEWASPPETICGSDDRIASTEERVGRIDPIGCTGWIVADGQLLTAGHCLTASSQILSFNVPPSLPSGTVQFPGPEDQYTLDMGSFQGTNGGVGNDWGTFTVADNTQTGLQPLAAQGDGFYLRQNLGPVDIRITGFGVDTAETNQTNQTNVGPNAGSSGTTMRYVTDTTGGNSGSPVIDEATDEAVGIHTHGGCGAASGNNNGTSLFNTDAWTAVGVVFMNGFETGATDRWSSTTP